MFTKNSLCPIIIIITIFIITSIVNEYEYCFATACGIQINSTNAEIYENSPLVLQITSSSSSSPCIFNISSVSQLHSIELLDEDPSVPTTLVVSNVTFSSGGISVFTDRFHILKTTTTTTTMTPTSPSFAAPLQIIVDSCSFGGGIINVTSFVAAVHSSSGVIHRNNRPVSLEVSNCDFAISDEENQNWGAINAYGLNILLFAKIINNTITSRASGFSVLEVENVVGDIHVLNNSLTTICGSSKNINVFPLRFVRIDNMSSGGFIIKNNTASLFESAFTRTVLDFQSVLSIKFILIDNNTWICENSAFPKNLPRRAISLNQTMQLLGGVRISNNYFRMNSMSQIALELWQTSGYGRGKFSSSSSSSSTSNLVPTVDFIVEGNTFNLSTSNDDGRAATGIRVGYAAGATDGTQDFSLGQFDSFQLCHNRFILHGARSSNQGIAWPLSDSYFTLYGVVFMRIWYVRDIIVKFNDFSLTSPIEFIAKTNVISLMNAIASDPSGEIVDVAQIQITENVVKLNGAGSYGGAVLLVPREDRVQSSFDSNNNNNNNNNNNGVLLSIVNFSSNFVDATNFLLLDETITIENLFVRAVMPSTSRKPTFFCFFFATTTELFIVENSTCLVSEQRLELFQPVLHFVEFAATNPASTLSKLVLRNNNFTMIPNVDDAQRTKIYFNITSSAYINKGKAKLLPTSSTYFITGHFGFLFFGPMVGVNENPQNLKKVIVENNVILGSGASVCSTFIIAMFSFGINASDITMINGEVFSINNNTLSYSHVAVSLNVINRDPASPFRSVTTIGYFCFYSLNVEVVAGIGNQPLPVAMLMPNPFFSAIQLGNIVSDVSSTAAVNPVIVFSNNRINFSASISPSSNVKTDKFGTFPICSMMNISQQNKESSTSCLRKFILVENNQGSFADCESGSLAEVSVTGKINSQQESATIKNNILTVGRSPTMFGAMTAAFLPDYIFRKEIFMFVGIFFWASPTLPTNFAIDVNLFNNFIVNTSTSSNPNYYEWKPILQFPPEASIVRVLNISAAPRCNSILGNGILDNSLQGSSTDSSQNLPVEQLITGRICRGKQSKTVTESQSREHSKSPTLDGEKSPKKVKDTQFFSSEFSNAYSSSALVIASLSASATSAGLAIRTRTILSGVEEIMLHDCGSPFTEEIFEIPPLISASPTQMYFSGERNGGYATGLIVGDLILILVLVGTWFLFFVLIEKYVTPFLQSRRRSSRTKRTFTKNIFTLRFLAESKIMIPAFNFGLMFLDPMFNSSIALIFIKEVGFGWKILGVVISILFLLFGFFLFSVIYKLLVQRNQIEKWHKFRPSELKTSKNPVLKLWYFLMDAEGEWMCPKEGKRILKNNNENNSKNNKKQEVIKVTSTDVIFWRFAEPVIDGFTNRFPRFAIVDILVMLCLAIALVIGHATANCTVMGILLIFPVAVHLLLVIFYRPDQEFLLRVLIPVTDSLQVILVGLALGGADEGVVTALAGILVAIQMLLTVLWAISIFLAVFNMLKETNLVGSSRSRKIEYGRDSSQNLRELMPPRRNNENRRRDSQHQRADISNRRNYSTPRNSQQSRSSSHRPSASPSSFSSSRTRHETPSSRPSRRDHFERENRERK